MHDGIIRALAFVLALALAQPAAAADQALDRQARTADIDALYAFMKATHPDLYHHTAQAEMDAYVAAFRIDAPKLSWPRFVLGVYRMLRLVGDGHTAVYPFPSSGPGFDTRLPILTEAFADGLYVIAADPNYGKAVGAKVVAVNGKRTAQVVQNFTEVWPHENQMFVVRWLPVMLRRPGYLHGVGLASGDVSGPVTFTIVAQDGTQQTIAVNPLPASEDEARQAGWLRARDDARAPKPTPLHRTEAPFGFHHLKKTKTVYAVYRQSDDAKDETVGAYANRLFKYVEANAVERLIIDIRENGGGNNYRNQPLLRGMIKSKLDRPGGLVILTGRQTFSAAQNFANHAERWTQSVFVGEPTASSPNHFGDAKSFELPATKLSTLVASLRWQDSDPKDTRVWIMPDVPARETFADYLAGRDVALEAALAYNPSPDTTAKEPMTHWYRPGQWIESGGQYTAREDFPFDWD